MKGVRGKHPWLLLLGVSWFRKYLLSMRCLAAPFILGLCISGACCSPARDLKTESSTELELRLRNLRAELAGLASYSLRGGVGNVGFRSAPHDNKDAREWIRIDLGAGAQFDQVVVVPTIWRDTRTGFRADGFPAGFRILAGKGDADGTEIARFGKESMLLPRIAPVVVNVDNTRAEWIEIEATELSARAWDGKYILQLSEIFVFDGEEDIALRRPVSVSSETGGDSRARGKGNLVDGLVPYLMDAQDGEQSVAMLGIPAKGGYPGFTIDLGALHPVNRIHLHEVELSDSVPQVETDHLGLPRHLLIEGASGLDFSDAAEIAEFRVESVFDAGPLVMLRFPERRCRYVRFTAVETQPDGAFLPVGDEIGFAEIEIFSRGKNIAKGKGVEGDLQMVSPERSLSSVTDGRNLYGDILPVRHWLGELARRHDLEMQEPEIVAELDMRHANRKGMVNFLTWTAALLAFALVSGVLLHRLLTVRRISDLREKLAADLHDELGGNLHMIGLLSDLAGETGEASEELAALHRRIRAGTERSAIAVRHCTDMLGAKELYTDFVEDMHRESRRIMARLDHRISVSGADVIRRQKPRVRAGLFLFYRESLVNISKHSGATRYSTKVTADSRQIVMEVSDNGCGLPIADDESPLIPASLRRRARLLGAKVTATRLPDRGTSITLRLKAGIRSRLFGNTRYE